MLDVEFTSTSTTDDKTLSLFWHGTIARNSKHLLYFPIIFYQLCLQIKFLNLILISSINIVFIYDLLFRNVCIYTLGKMVCYTPIWGNKFHMAQILCFQWAEIDMKYTCDYSPTKSTLPRLDFHFNSKWNRPKQQLRWSFSQICLRTVASSNSCIFFFNSL